MKLCSGGSKSCDFWKTIKPFFPKKCNTGEQNIVLCENDKIINDSKEVSEHFNNFFSTVAENIGKEIDYDPSRHPSILEIKKNRVPDVNFEFSTITYDKVEQNHE